MQRSSRIQFLRSTVALAAAAGCGPFQASQPAAPAASGTVEFQTDHTTGPRGGVMDRALEMFAQDFPSIRVDRRAASSGAAAVIAAFAAGTAGDVKLTAWSYNPDLIERNQLTDLTAFLRRDRVRLEDLYAVAERVHVSKGNVYGLPYQTVTYVLIYNKTLLRRGGVAFPTSALTWEDLMAAALKLTLREGGELKQAGFQTSNSYHNAGWGGLIFAAGGKFVNDEGTKTLLDQPVCVEPFTFHVELVTKHRVSGTAEEGTALRRGLSSTMAAGTGAFHVDQPVEFGRLAAIPELDWDIVPVPLWRNKKRVTFTADQPHVVPKGAKNVEGAWTLIKYLSTNLKVQTMVAEPQRRGFAPVLKSVVKTSPVFRQGPPANMKAVEEALDQSTNIPAFVGVSEWLTAVRAETNKAYLGQLSPVDALRAATVAGDAAITKARGSR